jgi:tripartite-type tricarboxylate transporter receptor subunit TctC
MKPAFRNIAFAALAAAIVAPSIAFGQAFPAKPVRLICPFPPAGAVDIASRAIAHELQKNLGQPVTVENRPGAGGNLGGEMAAKSAPDGYTLFMTTSGIQAINPALYSKMNYDPNKDLVPVAPLVSLNNVLVLHPSVPANSVRDVIAMAKANPGKLTYASSGNGTSIHMSGELFKHMTGVNMLHIPYKGSGPAVADLIGGQVNMMFDNIPSSLPHIKAGKLKALATTGAKRDPALPDLPTIAEAGVPGYESGVWFGIAVPAATPKDIIARLNAETIRGAKAPEFVKRMTDLGYLIIPGSADQMGDMIKAEITRWTPVVKASGAKID